MDQQESGHVDEIVVDNVTDDTAANLERADTAPDEAEAAAKEEKSHADVAPAEYPDPHPVNENPLDHVGNEQPDPWDKKEA
jgi:hypothetical protein